MALVAGPQFKFAANISTMFKEVEIYSRFAEAKKRGFKFVEAQNLYDYDIDQLRQARVEAGLEGVLINSPAEGAVTMYGNEQFGFACLPGIEMDFIRSVKKAISYSDAMKSKLIHVLAGLKPSGFELEDLKNVYIDNMKMAAYLLEEHNQTIVIEPICAQVKENYFMDSFPLAIECIEEIDMPNVKLLLDVYHMHMMGHKVEEEIPKYLQHTAHIQVSQTPNRSEPSAPGGEINYDAVFKILKDKHYNGYIGLEYTPSDSPNSFEWCVKYGFTN